MNIEASNLLSMLSGAAGLGNMQPGLLATGEQGGFNAALMEQLGLLQGSTGAATAELADLQNWMATQQLGEHPAALQDFAAMFGNALPTANKIDQDIDLDDTLQALAEVLQHLQALENQPDHPLTLATDLAAQQTVQDDAPTDADQQALAAQANFLTGPLSVPVIPANPLSVDGVAAAAALVQTLPGLKTNVSALPLKNPAALDKASEEGEGFALDFERGSAALLAQAADAEKAAATKLKPELAAAQLEVQSLGAESDKNPAQISSDIAKLNSAVRSEAQQEIPAMSKSVADPAWKQELGEKLLWMHKQAIPSAELRLNPQHLGPVLIKIDVNQDQTSVAFTTQHLAVKEAIEAAIPKLREMLGGQQLNLVDVNVSQQQAEQRQGRDFFQAASEQNRQGRSAAGLEGVASEATATIVDEIEAGRALASNGILSLFA